VLFCPRDLYDTPAALIAQRVIDNYLRGKQPRADDLQIVKQYFR